MQDKQEGSVDLDMLSVLAVSAAVTAAQNTGLLNALRGNPLTAAECASSLQLNERTTKCVLDLLVAFGILGRHQDRYAVAAGPSSPRQYTDLLLEVFQEVFAQTTRVLRTGEPVSWVDLPVHRENRYPGVVGELAKVYGEVAGDLAQQLASQPTQILDIGCGSGVWSLAIAQRHPQAQVTGLDFHSVLHEFSSRARALNLEARTSLLPGDMYTVDIPAGQFDLIVIANVLRLEAPARAEQLVARAVSALCPGGQLLIVDALASGLPKKELLRHAYGLFLNLRTSAGCVYSPSQIMGWMHTAGLVSLQEVGCGPQLTEIGAVLGEKPREPLASMP